MLQAALEGISGAVGQLGSAAATAGNGVYRVVAPRCAPPSILQPYVVEAVTV